MPDDISAQEFGRLQSEVAALRREVDRLIPAVENLTQALNQTQGGWRVLVTVGTIGAAIGSVVGPVLGRIVKLIAL